MSFCGVAYYIFKNFAQGHSGSWEYWKWADSTPWMSFQYNVAHTYRAKWQDTVENVDEWCIQET